MIKYLRHWVRRGYQSWFLRNLSILTAGTLVAQLIPLLMLPIFTRMYGPAWYGVFGLLQVGSGLLLPLSTGYFEWAVPSPRQMIRARTLGTIALALSCLTSLLVLAIAGAIQLLPHIPQVIAQLGYWIWVYPLITLVTSTASIANYWLVRQGLFTLQAATKFALAISTAAVTLVLGLLHVHAGLLIGYVAGLAFNSLTGIFFAVRSGFRPVHIFSHVSIITRTISRYREFPIFGSLPATVNTIAIQAPLLIITSHYSMSSAGHYVVARTLLVAGTALVSICVGQVMMKYIADLLRHSKRIWPYYRFIMISLLVSAVILAASVYVIGPWFLTLYLGKEWEGSANIARLLSFNIVFWLTGPTLALAAIAVHRLKAIALWQVIHGCIALLLLLFVHLPFEQFIVRVVMIESMSYALYTLIVILAVRHFDHEQRRKITPTLVEPPAGL